MSDQDGRQRISGQTFDDSDQILQVCREPMKFTRRRQETNVSDACPFSQFVTDEHPPGSKSKIGTAGNAASNPWPDVK